MMKLTTALLPLALLALPGTAAAQGTAQGLYFVFKLATTLPLTVQDTPECAAQQAAWVGVAGQTVPYLMTYSFVSPQSGAALRGDLETFTQDYDFTEADLGSAESAGEPGNVNRGVSRQFSDPAASGFSYEVRVYERPDAAAPQSVLCVTMLSPRLPGEPAPSEPAPDQP